MSAVVIESELWQKIPESYKQHADFYTDLYEAYVSVIPDKQHHRVIKQSGLTISERLPISSAITT